MLVRVALSKVMTAHLAGSALITLLGCGVTQALKLWGEVETVSLVVVDFTLESQVLLLVTILMLLESTVVGVLL